MGQDEAVNHLLDFEIVKMNKIVPFLLVSVMTKLDFCKIPILLSIMSLAILQATKA